MDFVNNAIFANKSTKKKLFVDGEKLVQTIDWEQMDRDWTGYMARDGHSITEVRKIDKELEKLLFLRYNFAKKMLKSGRNRQTWQAIMETDRKRLFLANIGLIYFSIRKTNMWEGRIERKDMVQVAAMTVLRTIEKFDTSLGWKFSTYCCKSIFSDMRRVPAFLTKAPTDGVFVCSLEKGRGTAKEMIRDKTEETQAAIEMRDCIEQNLAGLSDIEMAVIKARFYKNEFLWECGPSIKKMGISETALTKERIRQIQNVALKKIKTFYSSKEMAA
jgi:DNA-directed RNA polymerase sigma subunit (sigma70/sigma32)